MLAHHSANTRPGVYPPPLALFGLAVSVLFVHMLLMLGLSDSLDWRLPSAEPVRVAPLQTRRIAPPVTAPVPMAALKPRTRVTTEAQSPPNMAPAAAPAAPVEKATTSDRTPATPPEPEPPPNAERVTSQANAPNTAPDSAPAPDSNPASPPESPTDAASVVLPPIPAGALPPPVLLSYRLTGQDKGIAYHASGELRWQHNEAAYTLSLSVKAFLIGSRHWRSQGEIKHEGLAPSRFSDSWRTERAAHFDRAQQRVVFSNNAPSAALEAGAQDQISLYVQLAAAMAGEPQRFQPGTRLQVQTATIRDALPWLLTLSPPETLQLNDQSIRTSKWVCQPRNRFDATVEFWVSAQHAWMPVRIRITQVSGSFVDLTLQSQEKLPPLPAVGDAH